ncbi:MAG: hypothetical protein GY816_15065 [Cytophagales bacterium]|nr:hypothetical protein [Cytophagales bacterium]
MQQKEKESLHGYKKRRRRRNVSRGELWTSTIKDGLEERPRYKLAIAYQYIST